MKNKYFEKIYNCYEKDGFAFSDMNYEQFKSFMKDSKTEVKTDRNKMIQSSTLVINGINFDTYLVKYSTEKALIYGCMLNISYTEDDEVWGINNIFNFSSKDEKGLKSECQEGII